MNSVKEIDPRNCTHYSFDDMINRKNLNPNFCCLQNCWPVIVVW